MWRAMASLLVLRDQVNGIAPDRNRESDGLVGDAAHSATTSDHNPHYVAGVGENIVTALDLTHDPDGGFDSYAFAETLRLHRDKRIEYVISNRRIFSSYWVGSTPPWTWRTYTGTSDPHTNHVHISVPDDPISDTRTAWNLEGFMALTDDDVRKIWTYFLGSSGPTTGQALQATYQNVGKLVAAVPPGLDAKLDAILVAAKDDSNVDVVLPPDAVADLEEIKTLLQAVPTAQENAAATVAEIAS